MVTLGIERFCTGATLLHQFPKLPSHFFFQENQRFSSLSELKTAIFCFYMQKLTREGSRPGKNGPCLLSYFQFSMDTKQILKVETLEISNFSNQVCIDMDSVEQRLPQLAESKMHMIIISQKKISVPN